MGVAYARSAVKGFGPVGLNERGAGRALDRASRCGLMATKEEQRLLRFLGNREQKWKQAIYTISLTSPVKALRIVNRTC